MFRFQGQPLYKLRPSKFRAAIEEAFLAERGFFYLQTDEVVAGLWILSVHGSCCNFLTLSYIVLVLYEVTLR